MAFREYTDADFNADTRIITFKLEVYFDETPMTITRDDYLIDLEIIEEMSTDSSSNPLGTISGNELTFNLYNYEKMFTPGNVDSTLYGKIKRGIKVKAYAKIVAEDLDWKEMGEFYVVDWQTTVTGSTASVVATDNIGLVMDENISSVYVRKDMTNKQYFDYAFDCMKIQGLVYKVANVSSALTDSVKYSYCGYEARSAIPEMMTAARARCFCDRQGVPTVVPIVSTRSLRATLTDDDQVIDASAKQSISRQYNSAVINYGIPKYTRFNHLLTLEDITLQPGLNVLTKCRLETGPAVSINSVNVTPSEGLVYCQSFSYNPWEITLTINNTNAAACNADITVYGVLINFTKAVLSTPGTRPITVSNNMVQSADVAASYLSFLTKYANADMPTLNLHIRGNLLLKLNDKLTVTSTQYKLNFTGILHRITHKFNGAYSCNIVLYNKDLVEATA